MTTHDGLDIAVMSACLRRSTPDKARATLEWCISQNYPEKVRVQPDELRPPIDNTSWLEVTATKILELAETPDEDNLIGLYLNEVKESIGQTRFMLWLDDHKSFGFSDKQRQKLQRNTKGPTT